MKRILYVRSELNGSGLRAAAYSDFDPEWHLTFAKGVFDSFKIMQGNEVCAVVVEEASLDYDATKILEFAESRHPLALRFLIHEEHRGQGGHKPIQNADQQFGPGTDIATIGRALVEAFAFDVVQHNIDSKVLVKNIGTIPSLPSVYSDLMEDIERPESNAGSIANILARDVGMTSRTLQLANSALFAREQRVRDLRTAVKLIGHKTLGSMALAVGMFSDLSASVDGKLMKNLWDHSARVAKLAREIAMDVDPRLAETAFTAGMLHEIGTIAIASNPLSVYARLGSELFIDDTLRARKETEWCGVNHAQFGGYMLGRWGIPKEVVEAVMYHLEPRFCSKGILDAVGIVHIANAIVTANEHRVEAGLEELCDGQYLTTVGALDQIPKWETHLQFGFQSVA